MEDIENINDTINLFKEAAIKHTESTINGNYKNTNKYYKILIKAAKYLYKKDKLSLLTHTMLKGNETGVRLWSARFILLYDEEKALKVLNEIASENNIISHSAKMIIKEWSIGKLREIK